MKNKIVTLITLAFAITTSLSAAEAVDTTNSPSATVTNVAGPFKNGDALNALDAPQLANHALLVSAEIEPAGTNGVIIAQGAGGNGYALYLKDGKPAFAVRSETKLTTVIADTPVGSGHFKVAASLAADGAITISVDGKTVATGQAPGLIAAQPARGLSVGLNYRSVGDYAAPNPFTGKIENVKVQTW
jgi:arylsulfatase